VAAGVGNVVSGNFVYFDSATTGLLPEHVMASGALPPALPMVKIGTDYFWEVSNTPLQHLLDNARTDTMLVFQVDLFIAHEALPRDMQDVAAQQKDIQYSSRTRLVTDYFAPRTKQQALIRELMAKLPDSELSDERALKRHLARLPDITILHLICQRAVYGGQAKTTSSAAPRCESIGTSAIGTPTVRCGKAMADNRGGCHRARCTPS
jgi:NTE family protein